MTQSRHTVAAMAGPASWKVGSVDAQDFYLHANLLRVLSHGNLKVEDQRVAADPTNLLSATSSDDEEDQGSDDSLSDELSDIDTDESDISRRNNLVSSNNDKMKCRFLDRLAEFASAQKGAY